jgi:hypothetical protein
VAVVPWRGWTLRDLPPEQVLGAALDGGVSPAIVVGLDADGGLYVASSLSDGDAVIGLLHRAIAEVVRNMDQPA